MFLRILKFIQHNSVNRRIFLTTTTHKKTNLECKNKNPERNQAYKDHNLNIIISERSA